MQGWQGHRSSMPHTLGLQKPVKSNNLSKKRVVATPPSLGFAGHGSQTALGSFTRATGWRSWNHRLVGFGWKRSLRSLSPFIALSQPGLVGSVPAGDSGQGGVLELDEL